MSLPLRFKRRTQLEFGLGPIDIVPWIDVLLQLFIVLLLTSAFAVQTGISVKLPKTITSDVIKEGHIIVIISGEDVLYLNNKIVTVQELRHELGRYASANHPLLIKANHRASVGRIVEIWNLCRELGMDRINIATNQGQ